uniref:CNH domain-containing protein n=1 Tax=Hyaloperonospora arabidopsidis (strain Emoy2) TaxID=559515 RepID=M4BMQ6_HYAAE
MSFKPYAASAPAAVDRALKHPHLIERVLHSSYASSSLLSIGSSDGTLRSYEMDERASIARWQATHKRLFHSSCAFLDHWGVFITILDSRLKVFDLPLQMGDSGVARDDTKGAALFAVHEEVKTLCLLLQSSMLKVFDWTENKVLQVRVQHELMDGLRPVRQLVMLSERHVFVQGKKDWGVLDINSGRMLDVKDVKQQVDAVFEGGKRICDAVPLPSRHLSRRRQHVMDLLLCGKRQAMIVWISECIKTTNRASEEKDEYGAFRDKVLASDDASHGKTLDVSSSRLCLKVERVLEYDMAPRRVFYHHPFLLFDQMEHVAVYNFRTLQIVQTIPVKALYGLCAARNVTSATMKSSAEFKDDRSATLITVSPPFDIRTHQMVPVAQQIASSMGNLHLENAVALCKLCPDESPLSDTEQRKLYAEYSFELFWSARRREAVDLFIEIDVDIMEVLLLFPRNLLPRKASALRKANSITNKEHVIDGEDLVDSLLALIWFLRRKRKACLHLEEDISTSGTHSRRSLSAAEESTLELIDTMLVKCLTVVSEQAEYAKRAKHALLEQVKYQNWCDIGEAEVFLRAHQQFKALLAFYSARRLHRKVLELLEGLERSAASEAVLVEQSETDRDEEQLQSSGDSQSSHDYMVLIAQYLRTLGKKHAELVFEFSRRILSENPALGLSIFTQREVPDVTTDIDPAMVLQHLKSSPIASPSSDLTSPEQIVDDVAKPVLPLTSSRLLAIEYLTQLIYAKARQLTPRLHDEVVYLLLDSIQAETPQRQRLTSRVEAQGGVTGLLRCKLLQFLEFPGATYHPERMLSRTPIEMVSEHAALLSKLGRHREVLQFYVIKLRDAALAEAYCDRCYESKAADSSIYSTLLQIYLRPRCHMDSLASDTASPFISSQHPPLSRSSSSGLQIEAVNAVINLLNKYAERIDVPTALELLPIDIAVSPLASFFRHVLERQVERYRNGQVKKQLSKMENFKVREQLSAKRKGSVTVWSSQCCGSCGKQLGVGTFVRLPNGDLLHYSCQPIQ